LVSQRVWSNTNTSTTSSPYLGTHGGSRNHVLLANESGTSSGYTLYDFTGRNAIAQTSNTSNFFPVVISGHHIILKGLKVVGGESGIFIDPGSHDIVIDGCEITGYGRDSGTALGSGLTGNRAVAEDAGIKFPNGLFGPILETKRIVIQHSKIHNPAFGTNPWNGGAHPLGTTPILIYPTGGQIVIRYNEAYSTTNGLLDGPPDLNHFHEDGLTTTGCETPSEDNYTTVCASSQGIGPNVDIYKNVIMDYWDDGLETDGDGTNNRVWWNYIDYGGASAVSTRPAGTGPVYVWRNVYNRARQYFGDTQGTFAWGAGICNNHQNPTTPCEWDRSYMFKAGGEATVQGGRRYFYNNTALQAPASSEHDAAGPLPLGAGYGAGGTGDGTADLMDNTWTRNNVFAIMKNGVFEQVSGNRDFDYDLTNGVMGSGITETHGIVQTSPAYQNENATDGTANGWRSYWRGKYRLQPGTPGHDDGAVIPNFTDNAVGTPDRGAHEDGTPDMDFGTTASGS
jgi:hypothetical protein